MNTDYFKYLLTVADCHSIRQAAETLHMKQQNLSTIIKNVEHYYGVTIFERSNKGVLLTADGEFFLAEARTVVNTLNRMESLYLYPSKRCYSGIVDSITIYCTSVINSHNLVHILEQFREHFPYVNVNVLIRSREDILKAQVSDPKALSLLITAADISDRFPALPEDIVVEPFARTPVYAAASQNNEEAQQMQSISVYELLKKKLILLSQDQDDDTFVQELLNAYGTPNIQHVVNHTAIFMDLLQSKDLWTVCVADQLPPDSLLTIPFQEDLKLEAYLLYHKEAKDNFLMLSLLKLVSGYSHH